MSAVDAMQTVLAGTDAAVYAYGLCAARLSGREKVRALDAMGAHRAARDALVTRLAALQATPSPAAAADDPPFPISDAGSARRLAALVEDRLAGEWAQLGGQLTDKDRAWAGAAAVACSVRQVSWSGIAPVWNGAT